MTPTIRGLLLASLLAASYIACATGNTAPPLPPAPCDLCPQAHAADGGVG